jgi:N-acetylglutamate synthase-like GNAT family acetyltransferase
VTGFHLRSAVEGDFPDIRNLIRLTGINPLGLDWRRFLVAETDGGRFIGCGQLKPHGDGSVELASIAVEEEYRGRGVARAVIERLLAYSPRPLYLMCRVDLEPLYRKFGFRPIEPADMPPYFRRIRRIIGAVVSLAGREGPLIMRLD